VVAGLVVAVVEEDAAEDTRLSKGSFIQIPSRVLSGGCNELESRGQLYFAC
jgi:hypothetical protein